jgi:hypothetical protein
LAGLGTQKTHSAIRAGETCQESLEKDFASATTVDFGAFGSKNAQF